MYLYIRDAHQLKRGRPSFNRSSNQKNDRGNQHLAGGENQ